MSNTPTEKPETLIEFPADLSVKAMGLNNGEFTALVESLITPLVGGPDAVRFTELPSSGKKYVSVSAHFQAQNLEQLHAVYAALRGDSRVLYVL